MGAVAAMLAGGREFNFPATYKGLLVVALGVGGLLILLAEVVVVDALVLHVLRLLTHGCW